MTDVDDRSRADSPDPGGDAGTDPAAAAAARTAELQRIVFGADASEPERHSAAAELEELRRAEADAAAERQARSTLAAHRTAGERPGEPTEAEPGSASPFEPLPASAPTDARGIRWAIAAGAVALALGLGIGWQLGGRSVPPSEPMSTAGPDASIAVPTAPATVPLGETSMVGGLDRPQAESDLLDPEFVQSYLLDGESARRLLSRPDGLVVYSAVRDGELCLIASWTAGAEDGAPACTTAQIVNGEGLRTTVVNGTSATTATTVLWRRDGAVELTPAGEPAAEPVVAEEDEGGTE
ncbi:hypothetical protein ESP57_09515 [Agromyces fucosus]|uniref:Uncharacterized protein n=1 Tax=Agromyces fucosus TaxID=41985 RepID=A0A4Q2JQG7_9MICO|nr:hypothetical protein [Agromyces fucosus]RXZ49166.1 hypothetical protein ESP57_09515 [Agromyces fucosus]